MYRHSTDLYFFFADIDYCETSTCDNGGTCIDGIDDYTCECQEGYTGSNCETGKCFSIVSSEIHVNAAYEDHDYNHCYIYSTRSCEML